MARGEADFLIRFAQGGGFGAGVIRVDAAAGEADLAGVLVQMRGALGQQHRWLRALQEGDQHGGGDQMVGEQGGAEVAVDRGAEGGDIAQGARGRAVAGFGGGGGEPGA